MQYAHANRIPVTPRGAGTNLVGSTVPVDGGIILDLSQMNRILELDTETMTITVEPGLLLQDLQAYVEEHNLFYPPDPGEKASSIGGNISTNAGGMRAVKYGVTRDYVRGLEVVTADGTVLTVGGKNVKDASGLSLKHLYIGSEGTLAVITKCILKVIPKPETSLSILVPYPDLTTGIGSVLNILRADANPTAVEFMERNVVRVGEDFSGVRYPCPEAGSYILLTFDGREREVAASAERIQTLALSSGALDYIFLTDPQQAADIWKVRGALVKAVEAVSEQEPVDIVVPINRTAEFIGYINQLEQSSGMRMVSFGHAGDGNVHLCVVRGHRDEATWQKELHANMDKAYHKAYELGGIASGEHGIGISKRRYFLRETHWENLRAMNQIKDALDPLHILNDKKSYLVGGQDETAI
ncbi:MAG: FAD-binding oxidoreductase [Oscillospiraceae bacterium]